VTPNDSEQEESAVTTSERVSSWGRICEPLHTDLEIDPDGPSWRENAFFTFWDRGKGIYGQAHFTTSPNAGVRKARCHVWTGDRLVEIIEPLEPMSFHSQSIDVELTGQVTVRSAGFDFDFSATPRFEQCNYSQSDTVPSIVAGQPLHHYQGSGNFEASLKAGDERIEFSGVCFRDRTWGYREDSAWIEYYGIMCCFEDSDLTWLKFMSAPEDQRARGFLMGGRQGEIVETLVTERDSLGTIRSTDLTLDDATVLRAEMAQSACPAQFVPAGTPRGGRALTVYDLFQPTFVDGHEGMAFVEQAVLRQLS
jgi:hypothetical protein